jgi:hypothetical protein
VNIDNIKRQDQLRLRSIGKVRKSAEGGVEAMAPLDTAVINAIAAQGLLQEVMSMPDTRPEVIDLGRKLAQDPDYPSGAVLEQLAVLLSDEPFAQ